MGSLSLATLVHTPLFGCYVKFRLAYGACVWLTGLHKIVLGMTTDLFPSR